jgi:prepilin-type N-terminal cleavage/methylation domain-containing protein
MHHRLRRRAFTLTELLIVIALIVLLVTLLLTALSTVQARARSTTTLSTMQAFANACDTFQQEHGFYPGIVPERILQYDAQKNGPIPLLSSTENALLHLMGGAVRREDFTQNEWDNNFPTSAGWVQLAAEDTNGNDYFIKVNPRQIGQGPIIGGKPYPPYYTPSEREIGFAEGQEVRQQITDEDLDIPDLLDAWGQPILFVQQMRPRGDRIAINEYDGPGESTTAQFYLSGMNSYTDATRLGRLAMNQVFDGSTAPDGSILTGGNSGEITGLMRANNFARIIAHPALSDDSGPTIIGDTRGAYVLIAAGPDGVYFSAEDGAGEPANPVSNLLSESPNIIEEYDDVVVFGGD